MNKLLPFAAVVFIFSCKTPAVITQPAHKDQPASASVAAAEAILDSVMEHAFRFEYFAARAKVVVSDQGDKTEFTANLRVRKDSLIWVSVSPALGVEAARLLLTSDSVFLIDRLKKERTTKGYDFFLKYTSLPITLAIFQNLITGYPLLISAGKKYELLRNDSLIVLAASDSATTDTLIFHQNFLPYHQHIIDRKEGNLLTYNRQYDIPYTTPFSLWRKIMLHRPAEVSVEITFSKIKINEKLQFPFKME